MSHLEKARRVLEIEIDELQHLAARLDAGFERAVELMVAALENRGKIVVIGIGKSGHVGEKIAATLTSTGALAVVLHSVNALHGDLGVISDGDVLLVLSASGETEELVNLLPALRRFDAPIISLCGNPASTLARNSTVNLDVSVTREACPMNLAPTSSTTVMLALGDALAMVLLDARGFTETDFAKFHPGGSLGRKLLLKVTDIMRQADRLVTTGGHTVIREVLGQMRAKRSGAAAIVGADGRLAGIFTHGDFARHFEEHPGLGGDAVERYMTRQPVTIPASRLAVDVLHVLETHHIDDLIVVDADGRPIGIVDSQDLAKFKLL